MDESEIAQKILSLKLELAKKQKRLKKWTYKASKLSTRNQYQSNLPFHKNIGKQNVLSRHLEINDVNGPCQSSKNSTNNARIPKLDNILLNESSCDPGSGTTINLSSTTLKFPQNFSDINEEASAPPTLSHYNENIEKSFLRQHEAEEELFPDTETEDENENHQNENLSESEKKPGMDQSMKTIMEPNRVQNQLYSYSHETRETFPLSEKIIESPTTCLLDNNNKNPTPKSDSGQGKTTSGQSSEDSFKSLKRRSSRLASRGYPNLKLEQEKGNLDVKSVTTVAFEIICQMCRSSKSSDFDLPDIDFKHMKQDKLVVGRSLQEYTRLSSKTRTCKPDDSPSNTKTSCLSCHEPSDNSSNLSLRSIKASNQIESSQNCNPELVVLETEHHLINDISGNPSVLKEDFSNIVPEQVATILDAGLTDSITKAASVESENSLQSGHFQVKEDISKVPKEDLCSVSFKSSYFDESMCHNETKPLENLSKTDDIIEDRDISEICGSVLKTVIDILVISLSEKEIDQAYSSKEYISKGIEILSQELFNQPSEAIQIPANHSLKCEQEPVEALFMWKIGETDFLVVQQKSCFSGWQREDEDWVYMPMNFINNDETAILDVQSFGNSLALLALNQHALLTILTIKDFQFHVGSRVVLFDRDSVFLQGAVSGNVCILREDSLVATCLLSDGFQPQIQIHSLKGNQSVGVCNLEPPENSLLLPVINIQGLPNALLGCSRDKLFFWNIYSGVLLKTVQLQQETKRTSFRKCIWAKVEQGLLFGIFQEEFSEDWQMQVVNPATGIFQKLCRYACSSCLPGTHLTISPKMSCYSRVECHQLLTICRQGHLTVIDLLSGKPLITYKSPDPCVAVLSNSRFLVGNATGIIDIFEVKL